MSVLNHCNCNANTVFTDITLNFRCSQGQIVHNQSLSYILQLEFFKSYPSRKKYSSALIFTSFASGGS